MGLPLVFRFLVNLFDAGVVLEAEERDSDELLLGAGSSFSFWVFDSGVCNRLDCLVDRPLGFGVMSASGATVERAGRLVRVASAASA